MAEDTWLEPEALNQDELRLLARVMDGEPSIEELSELDGFENALQGLGRRRAIL